MLTRFSDDVKRRLRKARKLLPGPEKTKCWIWDKSYNKGGYGQICVNGKTQLVHRISYELFRGIIPPGLEPDHLCANPRCFNPTHLEPVTHTENILRGRCPNSEKELCPRGHTYRSRIRVSTGRIRRDCRICFNAARRLRKGL